MAANQSPRLVLLLKSIVHEGKFKHSGKHYLYNGRWHKLHDDKPAPKGAPVAHAPQSHAVVPSPHFTPEMLDALKIPDSNVNAKTFNGALAKLKEWSDTGNVAAILGAGYGTNSYSQKLAKIANHILGLYGSPHMVKPGQKAGTHGAVSGEANTAPAATAAEPTEVQGLGGYAGLALALKGALPASLDDKVDGFVLALNNGDDEQEAFDAADFGEKAIAAQKVLAEKFGMHLVAKAPEQFKPEAPAPEPVTAPTAAPLQMPTFQEGKTVTGVKALYEKTAQKIIDHANAGNVQVVQDAAEPHKKMWHGKTPNSKKLVALHAAALEHAKGGAKPAPAPAAAPATGPQFVGDGITEAVELQKLIKPGPAAAVEEINNALFSNYENKFVIKDSGGKVTAAIAFGKTGDSVEVHHIGSVDKGAGTQLLAEAKKFASYGDLPIKLYATKDAVGFYEKQGFVHSGAPATSDGGSLMQWSASGPKEGDTKPGADGGTLVLKDGHWVKQGGEAPPAAGSVGYQWDGLSWGKKAQYLAASDPSVYATATGIPNTTAHAVAKVPWSSLKPGVQANVAKVLADVAPVPGNVTMSPAAPSTSTLSSQQLQNLQSIPWYKQKLPDANTNAKSHNAAVAKIEAMAFAGDTAGLQAFIDAKGAAKQTYAKKQVLLAQTALAGLGEPGATAAVATEPTSSKPAKPTGLVSVHWSEVIDDIEQALNSGNVAKIDDHQTLADGLESAGAKAAHAYAAAALAYLSKTPPVPPVTSHFNLTGSVMVDAFKNKDIATLQENTQHLAGSDNKDAQAWHKYGADALAALGVAHVPTAADAASPEPAANEAFNGWKAAMAAGKQPTKEQAEAYAALEDSDPDTAMEAFNDAIQSNIAGDVSSMADDEFDASLQLATEKVHNLHGWALSGKPVGVHPSVLESLESLDISDLQEMLEVGSLKPEVKAHIEKMIKPLSEDEKAALNNLTLENLESMSKLQLSKPMLAHIKKLIVRHKMSEPVEPAKISVASQVFHNTTGTHSKSWSVSVHGSTLKTEYGKIGGTQQTTVKHLASPQAAAAMKTTLIKQKSANGYTYQGYGTHEHDADAQQGPKEGDTKMGADGMLILKDGHWVKMQTGDDGAGDWVHSPNDPGFSGAGTIGNHEGLVAFEPSMGAEYHDEASMQANTGDPAAQATTLQELVQKMSAAGHTVPPLHMLQKLDPSFSASDMPGAGSSASSTTAAAPAMDAWAQTGKQGGSNPGGKFKDPTGQEWYCKFPNDADTAKSEVLAAKLYALAGLSSQDAQLVTKAGKVGIASKWVNIKPASSATALAKVEGVHAGFAVDAWLGNWDVIGLALDNCQIGPDGKAHRVDAGGSLEYRAQGAKKPFGPKVDEIDTLRDAKLNPKSAAVFGKMTVADLTASVAKVAAIDDSAIRALVFDHGPGTEAQKKAMADTLIARKNDLIARFPKAAKPPKKALDPTALPINPASLPKVHDFSNWNGAGVGLSSKPHVNKSNEAVEQAMRSLAATGNMVALADFKFQEVNKDTGEPTGKMLPVSKHPSKHVLQYQQDLLQVLDEVANPPQPLKVFRSTDVGSLAALNAAFPPKPFGTTVAKVQSNEKLGFWVALGAIGAPGNFKPKVLSNYTTTAVEAAKAKYKSASKLAKHFISSVQSSGSYNDLFRDGKSQDHQGNLLKDVAQAALAHATAMPEGTCLYRWQKMSPQMLEHIMSAKDGTVFQATGPMCTSYSPTATKGFGTHRVKVVYAKGAKAVESFGSGGFAGEKEVTTLPNARFVILSKKMVPDEEHGNPGAQRLELEILMLPPDLGI
jgi:predicted DNA-binding WGR domain protein